MNPDSKVQGLPPPPPRSQYIHPVDLMEARLRNALQDSAQLIDVYLELYQLDYCQTDVGGMITTKLRPDAYCDPYEKFERPAWHSLKRAMPCAIGINEWLRWGMPARAGAFETELRTVLAELHSWVSHVRNLAFYPGLQNQRIRWEQNIAKGWDLLRELQLVAVESRSPAEWYDALQSALKVITAVDNAFSAYYESAKDLTADLSPEFNVLVEAFRPVHELLVRIGPRLVYAYDDDRNLEETIEFLPTEFAQCEGNLPCWREQLRPTKEEQERLAAGPPSILWDPWRLIIRLGNSIHGALQTRPNHIEPNRASTSEATFGVAAAPGATQFIRSESAEQAIRTLGTDRAPVATLARLTGQTDDVIRSRIRRALRADRSLSFHVYEVENPRRNTARQTYDIKKFWPLIQPASD